MRYARVLLLGAVVLAVVVVWEGVKSPTEGFAISGAVTVDDLDPGFSRGGPTVPCPGPGDFFTKSWAWCWQVTCAAAGCPYAGHYWYTWNCGPGTSSCSLYPPGCGATGDCNYGIWRPSLPYTASYSVCAYIPPDHAYTNQARYKVYHAGVVTPTQVNVDQQHQPPPGVAGWVNLGVYPFNAGTGGYLYLGDYTGETYATRQIGYDAAQWVLDGGPCGSNGPLPPDGDLDRVEDSLDNCPTIYNPGQQNIVHPLTPAGDACEDPDADGVTDATDNCPDDSNNDSDGDGVCNGVSFQAPKVAGNDNCPAVANPGQENNVHPGTVAGDACEDPDADGIFDVSDVCPDDGANDADNDGWCVGMGFMAPKVGGNDNCPTAANPGQENADGDMFGDACDGCPTVVTAWVVPSDDNPDCDGFPRTTQEGMRGPESFIGTDPDLACGVNAWPVDIDNDHKAGLSDILAYIPHFGGMSPGPSYSARFDLNADLAVGLQDILMFIPFFNMMCTP